MRSIISLATFFLGFIFGFSFKKSDAIPCPANPPCPHQVIEAKLQKPAEKITPPPQTIKMNHPEEIAKEEAPQEVTEVEVSPEKPNRITQQFEAENENKPFSATLKNPLENRAASRPIEKMTPLLRSLQGRFSGTLQFNAPPREIHQVEMEVDFHTQGETKESEKVVGNFHLTLSKEGHIYSNSSGDGDNQNIRWFTNKENNNKPEAIIEVHNDAFIHLTSISEQKLTGVFYERGIPSGKIILEK